MMRSDDRLREAQAVPVAEVVDRLDLKLKRVSAVESAGPCPDCGGEDRFAINTQKNVFNCRVCGETGDGIALVRLALKCEFPAALDWLVGAREIEISQEERARREKKRAEDAAQRDAYAARARAYAIEDARNIWASAVGQDPAPAVAYLAGRGISFPSWPPTIRCLADHPYKRKVGGRLEEFHRGPAMIAAIQAPDGRIRAVHQTWIDPDRPGRKAEILDRDGGALPSKLVRGSKKGGAIRLSPMPLEGGCLIVGEGIETTASVLVCAPVEGASYWAGVDLGNMAGRQIKIEGQRHSGIPDLEDEDAFLPPRWIERLIYLQDGDSNPAATRAKLLAGLRRAQARCGIGRTEIVAAPPGMDFNDVLRGEKPDGDDPAE
tara:strand:+ start:7023 stop:8153 length:1131 start_codon:yes stop_codon:yes gene_type:complete